MGSASHDMAFFREFLAKPLRVGAPIPTRRALAAAIAAKIPPRATGPVLELGAGTGAVTEAILARGIAPSGMVAVESEPNFAALLRRRFPQAAILQGNALAFDDLLDAAGIAEQFDAIVCGLPVIGHPVAQRRALLRMALNRLKPGAPFIQFCYAFWPPYPSEPGVVARRAETFWWNLPPMHIWVHASVP